MVKILQKWSQTAIKSLMILCGLFGWLTLRAQEHMVHTGEVISIDTTVNLYVIGNFDSRSSVTDNIINYYGVFHLQGNLIHNGTANLFGTATNAGRFRFFGNPATSSQISGSTPITFYHLDIDLTNNLSAGGKVELRKNNVEAKGQVQFLNGGFELDTNVFELKYTATGNARILTESVNARPYVANMNPNGKIRFKNYSFTSGATFSNPGGLGFTFYLIDGFTGVNLERRFDTLGVGHPAYNNIYRSFLFDNPPYNAGFRNAQIDFIDPPELGLNPDGNILNIFVSEDMGQVWRPRPNNTGDNNTTISTGSAQWMSQPNFTIVTAATPCESVNGLTVNQIITTAIPVDTIFDISNALVCDTNNINARVFAVSDPGAHIEWRRDGTNTYIPQNPPGYFEMDELATYWVRSTTIRGCIDSMSVTVSDTVPPNTAFIPTPTSVCLGQAIAFTPIASQDVNLNYAWSFDNGDSSFIYSPNYTYTSIGTYDVNLTITNIMGCSYSETNTVVVKDIPIASFSVSSACPNTPVSILNNSYVTGYTGAVYLAWNFGDATTGNTVGNQSGSGTAGDTTHIYSLEGTYPVTLTATANGCTSLPAVVNVTVYPSPVPSFTVANACEGLSTTFNNTSTISDASSMTYEWNFTGAGPIINTTSPTYAYPVDGTYNVTLTAISNQACSTSVTQPITIYENPIANFSLTNACVNNPAYFQDLTSVITGSTPYTYAWNFGDSNTGNTASESNVYTAPGTYLVSLTVTTSNGCVGNATQNVIVYPGPTVSFTALNACVNTPVNFINTSTNAVSYSWNIPVLAATPTTNNTTQTFTTDGTFPVYLAAVSSNGCSDTIAGSITIYPRPVVNLGGNISTCGTSYLLNADPSGTIAGGGGSFMWSTGATTSTLNATYNGTFNVTATSGQGCSASSSATITLNANVVPNLGTATVFCDSAVLDAGYPGSTYSWNTTETTQTITTTNSGNYSVTVTDQNGCTGSSNITISIVPSTPVNLGPDIQTACDDNLITLNGGVASSYEWSDGSTNSTLTASSTGYYWVEIINGGGCNSSDTVYINYLSAPVVNLGNDQTVCDQTILNGFSPNCTYLWSTGDTTTTLLVTTSNTYIVNVTNTLTTCDNSDTINVTVNPLPIVNLGNDFNICSYGTGTIDAGNPGATYQWNSGQTTQVITVAASGNYIVTVTDVNGCSESDNISVTQLPIFAIDLGADRQFCQGSTIVLDAELTTTGNTYLWEDESGVLGTNATWNVLDTGIHYLTVTDANNCVAKDSVNITPSNISLHAFYLADSDIENGESVVFVNLSYPRPYTSEWFLGNLMVSTDSMPTITFNLPSITPPSDTVYVKLRVDNQFCQSEITKPIVIHSAFAPPQGGEGSGNGNTGLYSAIRNSLLYPNPNRGSFNLMVDLINEAPVQFNIFSVTGALLHTETHTISTSVIPFDLDHLETGIYFVQIRVNNETRTHKFIVIHN